MSDESVYYPKPVRATTILRPEMNRHSAKVDIDKISSDEIDNDFKNITEEIDKNNFYDEILLILSNSKGYRDISSYEDNKKIELFRKMNNSKKDVNISMEQLNNINYFTK